MAVKIAPAETQLITGEDLAAMGDLEPSELIAGRIVPMTPTAYEHGEIELTIGMKLKAFVQAHNIGRVGVGEAGIYIRRNPDTIRATDVLYISHERYAQRKSTSYPDVAPELIVEILSPGDSWTDVTQKLRDYFSIGVQLVWIVDPAVRGVYAYRSLTDVREFKSTDDLPGDDVLPGFSVAVARLFED